MTLAEFFAMPPHMTPDEWQAELDRRHKMDKKMRRLSDRIFDLEDGLEVLDDERGSARWKKKRVRWPR